MSSRKPSPYSSFNSYNKIDSEMKEKAAKEKEDQKRQLQERQMQQTTPQQMNPQMRNQMSAQQMQQQMNPQMQQMNPQMQQMNPQMQQMNPQMQQMNPQMQQMNPQMQQMNPQMQQMNPQMQQMNPQMQQMPSRFKTIQSPEHLQNILTHGVEHFQTNFKTKGMQPPPMRLFLKLYTEWCTPCKKIAPVLDEISLSEQTKDIIFMKFDADLIIKSQEPLAKHLVSTLKVGAVPAFYGFVDGQLVGNVMGADRKEIDQLLQKLM